MLTAVATVNHSYSTHISTISPVPITVITSHPTTSSYTCHHPPVLSTNHPTRRWHSCLSYLFLAFSCPSCWRRKTWRRPCLCRRLRSSRSTKFAPASTSCGMWYYYHSTYHHLPCSRTNGLEFGPSYCGHWLRYAFWCGRRFARGPQLIRDYRSYGYSKASSSNILVTVHFSRASLRRL